MKKVSVFLFLFMSFSAIFAQNEPAPTAKPVLTNAPNPILKTAVDSASYAFGVLIAENIKKQISADLDINLLIEGLKARLKNEVPALKTEDCQTVYGDFNRKAVMKAGEKTREEGRVFLENNKKRPGVMVTASGLQYEIISKSPVAGVSPVPTNTVKVHYHGTLTNGEVFDSSVDRGQPAQFGLNQVIKGWTEGLQLMKPGDKFRFYIPYDLAYGERSPSAKIKPFAALIFDVELISIEK